MTTLQGLKELKSWAQVEKRNSTKGNGFDEYSYSDGFLDGVVAAIAMVEDGHEKIAELLK